MKPAPRATTSPTPSPRAAPRAPTPPWWLIALAEKGTTSLHRRRSRSSPRPPAHMPSTFWRRRGRQLGNGTRPRPATDDGQRVHADVARRRAPSRRHGAAFDKTRHTPRPARWTTPRRRRRRCRGRPERIPGKLFRRVQLQAPVRSLPRRLPATLITTVDLHLLPSRQRHGCRLLVSRKLWATPRSTPTDYKVEVDAQAYVLRGPERVALHVDTPADPLRRGRGFRRRRPRRHRPRVHPRRVRLARRRARRLRLVPAQRLRRAAATHRGPIPPGTGARRRFLRQQTPRLAHQVAARHQRFDDPAFNGFARLLLRNSMLGGCGATSGWRRLA